MGETRYNITTIRAEQTYPRVEGDIIPSPTVENTLLEVISGWDINQPYDNPITYTPFEYGNENNPVTRNYLTPIPCKDTSAKHPIYYCRVNGAYEEWIVFTWLNVRKLPSDCWYQYTL